MDYRKVSSLKLYEAFQKATPEERKPVLELIKKYVIMDEEDIKLTLLGMVERVYHPQSEVLHRWLENATTSPKGEHPRYVEGKGIYVPVIGKYLAMTDIREDVTWHEVKEAGINVPTHDEWYIILFFKDEINRLLRDNRGEELEKWYWTSTEYSKISAWRVNASNGNGYYGDKYSQLSVRVWVND